jgi:hypothetical protein
MIGGVDDAGGRRQCHEGVVNEMGREAALGVRRSGWDGYPRGERLEASQSAVWRRYSARGRTWGSRNLRQGSCQSVQPDHAPEGTQATPEYVRD